MKKIYTIAAGFLLGASLVSCELKEEILGKGEVPVETGWVELGVQVDNRTNVSITRAAADDAGEGQDTEVDPYNFPVSFVHQDAEYTLDFDTYEEMRETKSVELPIGTYTVTAHTPGELQKQMDHAYYLGEIDDLTVTSERTAQATVECKMQNSRIALSYEDAFLEAFTSWEITLDDSSDKVLTFTNENGLNLPATYWAIAENCSAIKVNITATTADGETVHESRTITKPEGAASNFWVGGDALNISMKPSDKPSTPDPDDPENPGEPEKPSGVSGIEISVDAFFESTDNETVEVPIEGEESGDDDTPTEPENPDESGEDGGDEPETPDTGSLSMTMPGNGKISYTIDGDDAPRTANVVINAPEGIKSLRVWITSGNDDFKTTIDDLKSSGLDFTGKGVEMVGNDLISGVISAMGGAAVDVPAKDGSTTEYSFPIHSFFGLMNNYGSTAPNAHVFKMTLEDNAGNNLKNQELRVTINPAN